MGIQEKVTGYLDYCEFRKNLDKKTLKAYRIDLRQYFDFFGPEDPQKEQIENYITNLHKNFKQKTVKRKIATIRAFYAYLECEELIEENPFRKIKVKFKETIKLPRIIPREEIEKLLNFMYAYPETSGKISPDNKYWLRDMAIVEVLFATGVRVYELSNIKADCININSGLIQIMGKGDKERYIQIGEASILRLLKRYYDANEEAIKKSGFFFINQRGNRFSEQSIRNTMLTT